MRGLPGRAAAIEIARLPAGRAQVRLSRAAIGALVRRAMPAVTLGNDGPAWVTFRRTLPDMGASFCFVARTALKAGEDIAPDRVEQGRCGGAASVRYDRRSGAIVATRLLAAGDAVGRALPRSAPAIARGETLRLRATSGPVTVERSVTALQPGGRGGRVFVRAGDGPAFAVPVVVGQ